MIDSSSDSVLNILIVDDHHLMLKGTMDVVQGHFPAAQVASAQTAEEAIAHIQTHALDLVMLDLSLPQGAGDPAHTDNGLGLLQRILADYPDLNLVIQSSTIKALIRLMPDIDRHRGGFTTADKGLPVETLLTRIDWSRQGVSYTKDLQMDLEVKPEWLEVLNLAFNQGLQDKAIAQHLYKSERMVRHYWSKIQDALGVYPEPGKSIRMLTQIRARELGLID